LPSFYKCHISTVTLSAEKLSFDNGTLGKLDKLGTSNVAHGLRMWKLGFGLLTYCTDDPQMAAVRQLGFSKIHF